MPQNQLVRYDAMCRAIDAAYRVDEVKDIRDKAVALEAYAKQAKNTEAERRACEIRLRAERKTGQLLAKTVKRGGDRKSKGGRPPLKNAGISHDQSKQWRKLGAIPQKDFDLALKQADKPTTNGIIRATAEPKQVQVSREALRFWGWLNEFERTGMMAKIPAELMETMTAGMLDDVHILAPKIVAWLKRIGASS